MRDIAVNYPGGDPSSPAPVAGAKLVIGDGCVRLIHEHFANMLHRRDLVIEVTAAALREICIGPPETLRSVLEGWIPRFAGFGDGTLIAPEDPREAGVAVVLAYDRAGARQLLVLSAAPRNADRIADEVQRLRTAASLPPLAPLSELEGLTSGTDIDVNYAGGDPSSPAPLVGARLVVSDGCVRVVREHFANMLHQRDVVIEVTAAELRGICLGPPDTLGWLLDGRIPSFVEDRFSFGAGRLARLASGRPVAGAAVVLAYERAGASHLLVLSTGPIEAECIAGDVRRLRTAAGLPALPPLVEDS